MFTLMTYWFSDQLIWDYPIMVLLSAFLLATASSRAEVIEIQVLLCVAPGFGLCRPLPPPCPVAVPVSSRILKASSSGIGTPSCSYGRFGAR